MFKEIKTAEQLEAENQQQQAKFRIAELQQKLRESDYVALHDYDQDKPELIAQRQAWRKEIRQLEELL